MTIVTYAPTHAEAIVGLYNATAENLPYCCPIDVEWFTGVIGAKHTFMPEMLWVYEERGKVIGYLQCAFLSRSAERIALDRSLAGVDALCFPPDRLDVAAELLDVGLGYLRSQGTREVGWSFNTGYPLYRGIWCGLEPAGCVSGAYHQRQALEQAGFYLQQLSHMWLVEMRELPVPPTPRLTVECRIAPRAFAGLAENDSWRGIDAREATATLDGRQIGACLFADLPGYRQQRGYAAGCIGGLSVSGDVRRAGIASFLVGKTMADLYERGARQVWVATQAFNVAAHFTYAGLGFRRFAEIYVLGRELAP